MEFCHTSTFCFWHLLLACAAIDYICPLLMILKRKNIPAVETHRPDNKLTILPISANAA